jgi:hypothetical protein
MDDLAGLPGAATIERGLAHRRAGRESVEALLVSVAAERLGALGLPVHEPLTEPELRMYDRLRQEARGGDDPYAQYNALLRELDSFLEALETRRRRGRPGE